MRKHNLDPKAEVIPAPEVTPEVQAVIDKWRTKIAKGEVFNETEVRREVIRAGGYRLGVGKTDAVMKAIKEPAIPKAKLPAKVTPAPEEQLGVTLIKLKPIEVARKLGYEVHKLSPKDVIDKGDYAEGYRYRISKTVEGKPYPDIIMARSEKEITDYLLKQRVTPAPEVTMEAIRGKIAKGQTLTTEEEQFRLKVLRATPQPSVAAMLEYYKKWLAIDQTKYKRARGAKREAIAREIRGYEKSIADLEAKLANPKAEAAKPTDAVWDIGDKIYSKINPGELQGEVVGYGKLWGRSTYLTKRADGSIIEIEHWDSAPMRETAERLWAARHASAKAHNPAKLERCVASVQKKIEAGELPKGSSPYAICQASIKGGSKMANLAKPEPLALGIPLGTHQKWVYGIVDDKEVLLKWDVRGTEHNPEWKKLAIQEYHRKSGGSKMANPVKGKLIGLKRGAYGILAVDETGKIPSNFHSIWFRYDDAVRAKKAFLAAAPPGIRPVIVDVALTTKKVVGQEVGKAMSNLRRGNLVASKSPSQPKILGVPVLTAAIIGGLIWWLRKK